MRAAELKVSPLEGDDFPAELVVFVFPGGVGPVQANIDRWKKQFTDKDGNPAKIDDKKVKGKNVDVTRVETSGHYHPSQFPGVAPEPDRDAARLLGGIVVTDKVTYVIKMVGPDKTMIDIYADPTKTRNCHVIEVDADSASFTLSIENIPSENPKTGRIVALSVIATLRKLAAPLRVGT